MLSGRAEKGERGNNELSNGGRLFSKEKLWWLGRVIRERVSREREKG